MLRRGEQVTLHKRAGETQDAHNNDVPAYQDIPVSGVVVAPRSDSELVQGQDTVITGLTTYWPAEVAVAAVDQATVRGFRYDVDGEPFAYQSPFTGWHPGSVVNLTRATG